MPPRKPIIKPLLQRPGVLFMWSPVKSRETARGFVKTGKDKATARHNTLNKVLGISNA